MKNFIIAAMFLFSASAFAGTVHFSCVTSSATVTGTLNENGTGVLTLNGKDHAAEGSYKVYPKGTYCALTDLVIMTVLANDNSIALQSIHGNSCGGLNGDMLVFEGARHDGQCTITND